MRDTILTKKSSRSIAIAVCVGAALATVSVHAADSYWDSNGTTPGAGTAPTGTWGTSTFWSTDLTGGLATAAWTAGDIAHFSAGTDATGTYTVTLGAAQTASGLFIEEGSVALGGTFALTLGANNITIASGTILSTDSNARISTTAGSKVFVNGGTLQTTNPGAAGTFFDTDSEIVLTGNSTFSHTTANILNIVQTASKITGTGSLTKTGAGVLAIASTAGNNTYSGGTFVNEGELRIRTVANTLPIATALTVASPGIFNLNGVSQQVGSLTGTGNVGTGSGTLTINGSANTTFDGAIKNIANAGASGVTTGNGRLVKDGSGVITFNGVNDINGSVTLTAGGITVNSTGSLCGDIADLTVNGGVLTLKQSAETIENLAGAGGTINLDNASLSLISDPIASTTFAGTITGIGGLTRKNASTTTRTLTLTGNNDYSGNTIVDKGIISVGNATGLGSTAGYTQVTATGAEVLFTGTGGSVTTNEPFRLAGAGSTDNGAIAVIAAASPTIAGPVTLIGDTTISVSSTSSVLFNNPNAITSLANQNLTLQGGSGVGAGGTIDGVIALGSGGLTKLQNGTWTLKGVNTYTGPTLISAGRITLANTGSVTSNVTVANTGTLRNDGTVTGNVQVDLGGTLQGIGTINGATTIAGTLSPGNSAGLMTINGAMILLDTATTSLEVFNPGTPGVHYDAVIASSVAYEGQLNINFDALGTYASGNTFNFFDGTPGLTDFNGIAITGAFSGSLTSNGAGVWSSNSLLNANGLIFTFNDVSGELSLSLAAVPEPLTAAGVLMLAGRVLGRRSRVSL